MLNFGGVNGITQVMAGTIGYVGDKFVIWVAVSAREHLVKQLADELDHGEIVLLVVAPYVIGLTGAALMEDAINGGAVIAHIKPVADVLAGAINGNRLLA